MLPEVAVAMAGDSTCTCLLVAATREMSHRGSSSVFRTLDLGPPADRERGPVTTTVTYPAPASNLRGTSPSVASPAARGFVSLLRTVVAGAKAAELGIGNGRVSSVRVRA
ncbi:hypothetical protein SORBI_3007G206600 [Sorghum bicolor]|uniref:Uncharacterized protein n=1 Tax=Sorghum bicolor TaxID=4558 RepID=A0A1B6PJ03_SORBI|nr:hypothetical protein SORBI_3007G206600 [Sorghum bicolor]